MSRHLPVLRDGMLIYQVRGALLMVVFGTAAWKRWIQQATSFRVEHSSCSFLVRKEQAGNHRGRPYWRAYHTSKGRLTRLYIGSTKALTKTRFDEIAHQFTRDHSEDLKPAGCFSSGKLPSNPLSGEGATRQPALSEQPFAASPPAQIFPPFLSSRLTVPPLRARRVARPRLQGLLNQATEYSLTLVSAPAGSGKTSLLSTWASEFQPATDTEGRHIAWLSLEAENNDPTLFWRYVIAALEKLHPGAGQNCLPLLVARPRLPLQLVLTHLLNTLSVLSQHCILVIDDYHMIETPEVHESLIFLLEHLPLSLHLVLASRTDPPLPLARWRARHQMQEIRTIDLRFTKEETEVFLRQVMNLALTAPEMELLQSRTEGWIAGLQLAALALRRHAGRPGDVASIAGSSSPLFDYLTQEILAQFPQPIYHFVLCTCILEQLTGSLCNALTGQENGHEMLCLLEQRNLFLVPIDEERYWYRYHPLFAEAVQQTLRLRFPALLPILHQKASRWYEQQGNIRVALEHALAASDMTQAALLLARYAENHAAWLFLDLALIRHWCRTLPPALLTTHPHLRLLSAWLLQETLFANEDSDAGAIENAATVFQHFEHSLAEIDGQALPRSLRGIYATLLTLVHFHHGAFKQLYETACHALDWLPLTFADFRCMAAYRLFILLAILGRGGKTSLLYRAEQELTTLNRVSAGPYSQFAALHGLAALYHLRGELHQAFAICQQAFQLAEQQALAEHVYMPLLTYVEILLEWNDLAGAAQHLDIALQHAARSGDPAIQLHAYRVQIKFQQAQENIAGALGLLETMAHFINQVPIFAQQTFREAASTFLAAWQARLYLVEGNLRAANAWADSCPPFLPSDDDSLLVLAFYKQMTLMQVALANREAEVALQLGEPLLKASENIEDRELHIQLHTLHALAFFAQGRRDDAVNACIQALALAEPGNYIRTFLDVGPALIPLLLQVLDTLRDSFTHTSAILPPVSPRYGRTLLAACGELLPHAHQAKTESPSPQRRVSRVPPFTALSKRELMVLRLLEQGHSDAEIAEILSLAPSTINTHLKHIYAKLLVHNRTQAVLRAHALGLLSHENVRDM